MLESEPDGAAACAPARQLPVLGPVAAPDREVVDSARIRLKALAPGPAAAPADPDSLGGGPLLTRSTADLRAVDAVIQAARRGDRPPPDPLDVGAALVLLANLRTYLDRLEADLLDAVQRLSLSPDLVAAILGLPAAEVQGRQVSLRARPGPQ